MFFGMTVPASWRLPGRRPESKGDPRDVQSHPVKRVVSGALAACAVIAVVTFAQTPATASPTNPAVPAPQQPQSTSEALEKYRELATKAQKLNEEYLSAKQELADKKKELEKYDKTLEKAKKAEKGARKDEEVFRKEVDRFAGASFTSGAQLSKLSALLTGDSPQHFLDRSSAIDLLATDKNRALQALRGAVDKAEESRDKAAEARQKAKEAKDKAAKIAADLKDRKEKLDEQIEEVKAQAGLLSDADKAQQQDTGPDPGKVTAPGAAAQVAVDAALSQRGKPYAWGATGPNSYDCSGLTQWAYAQAGISIPRNSGAQSGFGTPIPRSQLQPGDLVFFGSPVYHVGIYIGGGNMVHAPTTGDVVKVAPIQAEYSGARRVA
ncbi:NlpC/P60 family protein [Saccharomonospora azurea]|uniref:Cell wall-associated hydrolase, invasion-associated protein n=1 Tax=Saccharomonospora azurea NA-128 TaxID=882081 RepID=H8GCM1_9PSEU|nr:C40 family peptidase [Saccharomonospora azurea]EHK85060.1 cell wall-associated hydrolase, invasion-associated protein [Saccharomonospora azurea SZMC 14600]EHY90794.1 cell wall-associated hydrolase, invasion-associated protein [Saccharomonospora azurea NA-128]